MQPNTIKKERDSLVFCHSLDYTISPVIRLQLERHFFVCSFPETKGPCWLLVAALQICRGFQLLIFFSTALLRSRAFPYCAEVGVLRSLKRLKGEPRVQIHKRFNSLPTQRTSNGLPSCLLRPTCKDSSLRAMDAREYHLRYAPK